MSVEIGNFVSFFGLEEDFKHVGLKDIERFIDEAAWYKVEDIGDTWLDVQAKDGTRTIHVNEAFDEYQVYTKEGLREHLKELLNNNNHTAIIAKIRQLYRKQEFQFKGV
jgi:thymidine kinase